MAWKFNRKQLGNPTPASIAFWVKLYSTIMVAFMAWMPTATFISHNFQDVSTSIIGLTVTIANLTLPFFGVQVSTDDVPAEKVTAMEDNGNNKK